MLTVFLFDGPLSERTTGKRDVSNTSCSTFVVEYDLYIIIANLMEGRFCVVLMDVRNKREREGVRGGGGGGGGGGEGKR